MPRRKLTIKQAKFVKHYAATNGNGFQAAKAAGYQTNDETLRSIASENLTKPNVQQELQRTLRKVLSPDEVLAKLAEVADEAPVIKGSDKLKALELIGRFHKLFTDKVETSSPQDEQRAKLLAEIGERYGLDQTQAAKIVDDVYGTADSNTIQ